jgi:hypothetical protein
MKKSIYSVLSALLFSGAMFAQSADIYNPAEAPQNPKTFLNAPPVQTEALGTLIFDNGNFVSAPGTGPSGSDGSVLEPALNMWTLGLNFNSTLGYRMADDFTVPVGFSWKIDSVKIYGYQTGSTTTSTFTGGTFRIWKGTPDAQGSILVYGDTATNRMTATRWSGAYRYSTTAVGTTRPIMEIVMACNVTLQPGAYYIDFSASGTLSSGPWCVPVTLTGKTTTGNGLNGRWGSWSPYLMDSTATGQGWPFKFFGSSLTVPVELASFTSSVKDGIVTLSWMTATETNNSGFQVERKAAKEDSWTVLDFVKGNSTTSNISRYTYTDNVAKFGEASYSYRLKQMDFDGSYKYYTLNNSVEISTPKTFSLDQNYPNPFNPSTTIAFSVPSDSKVSLQVYDILGKVVKTLVNGQKAAGSYTVSFDASSLSSGVYFYKLTAGENSLMKKMNLIK